VDSMLQFTLELGGNGMKRCQKMRRRQQSRLCLMKRKRNTTRRCDDVDRRRGSTEEGENEKIMPVGLTRILLNQK
jgi:hypothetical protein